VGKRESKQKGNKSKTERRHKIKYKTIKGILEEKEANRHMRSKIKIACRCVPSTGPKLTPNRGGGL
jgi:hypothetical protein